MTFQNLYRACVVLLAAHCVLSTGEVGSPTEGLTRGPLAAAPLASAEAPQPTFEAHELTLSQPRQGVTQPPYGRETIEASYSIARD